MINKRRFRKEKMISICIIFVLLISTGLTGCSKKANDTSSGRLNNTSSTTQDAAVQRSSNVLKKDLTERGAEYDIFLESDNSIYGYNDDYIRPSDSDIANTEEFTEYTEAPFIEVSNEPLSTFSIDVDTASYSYLRKSIQYGMIPNPDSVRIEEMLNYFSYDYEKPGSDVPFTVNVEVGVCPWQESHYLMKIGIQGKEVDKNEIPKSNLVFLIDVSGSMDEPDKLPLLKNAFSQLVEELDEEDKVSIVVYAGNSGVVLDSARGDEKKIIRKALDNLMAGGSTAGAEGLEKAYKLAEKNFIKGGNNRVILATDGDFNVGPSSLTELEKLIEKKRESGIYLSVMGFGMGNVKDNRMELLADKGNGNYAYIDSPREAKKVLVDEMAGTLLAIAKDVKIQIEFNPYYVQSYRLIGYENRALRNEDFTNDKVDAGELGAGHCVTALYEIVPRSKAYQNSDEDLKYQTQTTELKEEYLDELAEVRLRYKKPEETVSKEIKKVVYYDNTNKKQNMSGDFYFAAAVAEFGMLLRDSSYKGNSGIESVLSLAEMGLGKDQEGYRREFIDLVKYYKDNMYYYMN